MFHHRQRQHALLSMRVTECWACLQDTADPVEMALSLISAIELPTGRLISGDSGMGRMRRSRACTDGAIISGLHSHAPERVSQVTRSTPSIVITAFSIAVMMFMA
jgi:hypothetical protein